jgi:hypothetical protein
MDGKAKGFAIRSSFLTCFSFFLTDRICRLFFSANWMLSSRVKMVAISCANAVEVHSNIKKNKTSKELRENTLTHPRNTKGNKHRETALS